MKVLFYTFAIATLSFVSCTAKKKVAREFEDAKQDTIRNNQPVESQPQAVPPVASVAAASNAIEPLPTFFEKRFDAATAKQTYFLFGIKTASRNVSIKSVELSHKGADAVAANKVTGFENAKVTFGRINSDVALELVAKLIPNADDKQKRAERAADFLPFYDNLYVLVEGQTVDVDENDVAVVSFSDDLNLLTRKFVLKK